MRAVAQPPRHIRPSREWRDYIDRINQKLSPELQDLVHQHLPLPLAHAVRDYGRYTEAVYPREAYDLLQNIQHGFPLQLYTLPEAVRLLGPPHDRRLSTLQQVKTINFEINNLVPALGTRETSSMNIEALTPALLDLADWLPYLDTINLRIDLEKMANSLLHVPLLQPFALLFWQVYEHRRQRKSGLPLLTLTLLHPSGASIHDGVDDWLDHMMAVVPVQSRADHSTRNYKANFAQIFDLMSCLAFDASPLRSIERLPASATAGGCFAHLESLTFFGCLDLYVPQTLQHLQRTRLVDHLVNFMTSCSELHIITLKGAADNFVVHSQRFFPLLEDSAKEAWYKLHPNEPWPEWTLSSNGSVSRSLVLQRIAHQPQQHFGKARFPLQILPSDWRFTNPIVNKPGSPSVTPAQVRAPSSATMTPLQIAWQLNQHAIRRKQQQDLATATAKLRNLGVR